MCETGAGVFRMHTVGTSAGNRSCFGEEAGKNETEGLNVKQESFAEIVEEMNAGVDERDDDDIEKVIPVQEEKEKDKEKKKKKHRKVERKGA